MVFKCRWDFVTSVVPLGGWLSSLFARIRAQLSKYPFRGQVDNAYVGLSATSPTATGGWMRVI